MRQESKRAAIPLHSAGKPSMSRTCTRAAPTGVATTAAMFGKFDPRTIGRLQAPHQQHDPR